MEEECRHCVDDRYRALWELAVKKEWGAVLKQPIDIWHSFLLPWEERMVCLADHPELVGFVDRVLLFRLRTPRLVRLVMECTEKPRLELPLWQDGWSSLGSERRASAGRHTRDHPSGSKWPRLENPNDHQDGIDRLNWGPSPDGKKPPLNCGGGRRIVYTVSPGGHLYQWDLVLRLWYDNGVFQR